MTSARLKQPRFERTFIAAVSPLQLYACLSSAGIAAAKYSSTVSISVAVLVSTESRKDTLPLAELLFSTEVLAEGLSVLSLWKGVANGHILSVTEDMHSVEDMHEL